MKIIWTLFLAMILDSIELSSQFESLPDGNPIPNVPRCGSSAYFLGRHSPERLLPPARPHSSARWPPPAEPSLRARSRSPARNPPSLILGFTIEELRFVRLILKKNPVRIFKLRKYTFPTDKQIVLRTKDYASMPMPTEERIVLSTPNGDVCAIFEKTSKHAFFRGIYKLILCRLKRAKINMDSGAVQELTAKEIAECPVGNNIPIKKSFEVVYGPQFSTP